MERGKLEHGKFRPSATTTLKLSDVIFELSRAASKPDAKPRPASATSLHRRVVHDITTGSASIAAPKNTSLAPPLDGRSSTQVTKPPPPPPPPSWSAIASRAPFVATAPAATSRTILLTGIDSAPQSKTDGSSVVVQGELEALAPAVVASPPSIEAQLMKLARAAAAGDSASATALFKRLHPADLALLRLLQQKLERRAAAATAAAAASAPLTPGNPSASRARPAHGISKAAPSAAPPFRLEANIDAAIRQHAAAEKAAAAIADKQQRQLLHTSPRTSDAVSVGSPLAQQSSASNSTAATLNGASASATSSLGTATSATDRAAGSAPHASSTDSSPPAPLSRAFRSRLVHELIRAYASRLPHGSNITAGNSSRVGNSLTKRSSSSSSAAAAGGSNRLGPTAAPAAGVKHSTWGAAAPATTTPFRSILTTPTSAPLRLTPTSTSGGGRGDSLVSTTASSSGSSSSSKVEVGPAPGVIVGSSKKRLTRLKKAVLRARVDAWLSTHPEATDVYEALCEERDTRASVVEVAQRNARAALRSAALAVLQKTADAHRRRQFARNGQITVTSDGSLSTAAVGSSFALRSVGGGTGSAKAKGKHGATSTSARPGAASTSTSSRPEYRPGMAVIAAAPAPAVQPSARRLRRTMRALITEGKGISPAAAAAEAASKLKLDAEGVDLTKLKMEPGGSTAASSHISDGSITSPISDGLTAAVADAYSLPASVVHSTAATAAADDEEEDKATNIATAQLPTSIATAQLLAQSRITGSTSARSLKRLLGAPMARTSTSVHIATGAPTLLHSSSAAISSATSLFATSTSATAAASLPPTLTSVGGLRIDDISSSSSSHQQQNQRSDNISSSSISSSQQQQQQPGPRIGAYVDHPLSPALDVILEEMVSTAYYYQERARASDPRKAGSSSKKRIVIGLREVARGCRTGRIKAVLITPNLEAGDEDDGGLGSAIVGIIASARAADPPVPVLFGLSRKKLGKALGIAVRSSVVGFSTFENLRGLPTRAIEMAAQLREGASQTSTSVASETSTSVTLQTSTSGVGGDPLPLPQLSASVSLRSSAPMAGEGRSSTSLAHADAAALVATSTLLSGHADATVVAAAAAGAGDRTAGPPPTSQYTHDDMRLGAELGAARSAAKGVPLLSSVSRSRGEPAGRGGIIGRGGGSHLSATAAEWKPAAASLSSYP